jgi:hypothetical protein
VEVKKNTQAAAIFPPPVQKQKLKNQKMTTHLKGQVLPG